MTQFSDFGLAEPILKALAAEGYNHPTPIQEKAIPPLLNSVDMLGLAQTGTGKTAAFALPLLHHLSARRVHAGARGCRALILSPTRELAGQIADSFRAYGRFLGLSGAVVYGGANMRKQIRSMERGVDILIATPGRLIDLVKQRAVRLDKVEHLILDEADQMLDMGFIKPIRTIVAEIPEDRQTMLFSATMPKEIQHLANELLRDPVRVETAPAASPADKVEQSVILVRQDVKQAVLHDLVSRPEVTRAMIFVRTKHGADKVALKLEQAGESVDAVHGNKSQNARERALEGFRKGHTRLLVATDVAARGIDVDGVSHVFNFDLPDVPEAYVHRIGRTARNGMDGIAISFCAPHERDSLRDIERLIKRPVAKAENAIAKNPPPKPAPGAPRQDTVMDMSEGGFVPRNEQSPHGRHRVGQRHAGPAPSGARDERRSDTWGERPSGPRDSKREDGRGSGRGPGRDFGAERVREADPFTGRFPPRGRQDRKPGPRGPDQGHHHAKGEHAAHHRGGEGQARPQGRPEGRPQGRPETRGHQGPRGPKQSMGGRGRRG